MVFATNEAHQYKNTMLQKSVSCGFAGTSTKPVFLYLHLKQRELDFPTRKNGKTIILFFSFYSFWILYLW